MVIDFDCRDYNSIIVSRTLMIKIMLRNCHDKNCDCTVLLILMMSVIDDTYDKYWKNCYGL